MKTFVHTLTLTAKPKRLASLALSALSALVVAAEGAIANNGWQPETLRGISQLQVQVKKEGCRVGASEDCLRSVIESYLSRNGIPIGANPSNLATNPRIRIAIDCQSDRSQFAYTIDVEVLQAVTLNSRLIEAVTYTVPGGFGRATVAGYSNAEGQILSDILNDFIADWNSVR